HASGRAARDGDLAGRDDHRRHQGARVGRRPCGLPERDPGRDDAQSGARGGRRVTRCSRMPAPPAGLRARSYWVRSCSFSSCCNGRVRPRFSQSCNMQDLTPLPRPLREVVYVDGVRTAFGKATPDGLFAKTRADDMVVKLVRELLRRQPSLPPERIDDVIVAATAQVGDQGLTLGRDVALLAGLPHTVPGFAVDRMCAGALPAVTACPGQLPV